ncbi:MAG TPA: hypothetical protein VGY99_16525 [Candidatus Binataceae bacterium]|nr:hypothetical protein [Candidatus Binataceae bacterium]
MLPRVIVLLRVPPALQGDARMVVLSVVGIFLLDLALCCFDDALSGCQRTAEVQTIWTISYLVETALIFWLISRGYGVKGLAYAFVIRTLLANLLSAIVAYRTLPWLHLSPRRCSREAGSVLLNFGGITQLQGLLAIALNSIERAIAAPLIGLAAAGLLDIGKKLPAMAASVPSAFVTAFMPAASYLHGGLEGTEEGREAIAKLYLKGARYMNLSAGYICGLLATSPLPILLVWMGKLYPGTALLMVLFSVSTQVHLMTGPGTSLLGPGIRLPVEQPRGAGNRVARGAIDRRRMDGDRTGRGGGLRHRGCGDYFHLLGQPSAGHPGAPLPGIRGDTRPGSVPGGIGLCPPRLLRRRAYQPLGRSRRDDGGRSLVFARPHNGGQRGRPGSRGTLLVWRGHTTASWTFGSSAARRRGLNAAFSGSATSQAVTAAPGRKIAPLASLRRHRTAAVVVGISLMLLGAIVAVLKGKPTYAAEAAIRISPVFSKTLQEDVELRFNSNSDYREFVQQQVVDIDSYETAQAALRQLGSRRWLWQRRGETDRRAAERLMAAVAVHPVPDTYLVTIGLEDAKRAGLADIVNAVAAAYLARQQSQELYGSDRRVELLQARRKELEGQIKDDAQRQAEIGQELGVSTFEEKFINPYDKALMDGSSALETARRERIDAGGKLNALRSHIKRILDLQIESQAQEVLANDRALGDLRTELYRRRAVVFLQLRGLAPGHPGRPALLAELADIDRELARITEQALDRIRTMLLESRANKAQEELSEAVAKVDQTRSTEAGLAKQLDALRGQVTEFTNRYNEALTLRTRSDRARKQTDEIDDRINFLTLESKAPGFVRLASAARPPEIPVKGGKTKIFLLFAIAGVGLGGAIPVAIDYLDPRVLSAAELHKILGFPPLGITLEGSERLTVRGRDLVKRIALGIARERRASGNRLFVLTACHDGAGVTTLVLELAREIAALGVSAVAVEANVEHVDKRYRLLASTPGLIEALSGNVPLEETVSPAAGELPARMALGSIFDFHRVWKVEVLRDLFARLSEQYDVVLIDAPALLDSAEPELLIGLPAAAILVVMAGEYSAVVRKATQLLERFSPPVVGAVFSRVNQDPASGPLGSGPNDAVAVLPFGLPVRLVRWLWHEPE